MILLGKPAPDFALTVIDNTGSSRKVSKSDLSGKVVVIAYWSMQTEPCFEVLRELSNIVRAANANDRVVLVAVNVDEDRGDLKALSARVRQALLSEKVAIEESRGGWIAVDPTGAIADLLPVAGLPAVVLLDGKGVVQTSHVGTGAELTDKLSKEIKTLLAGAPLETPELEALNRVDTDESRPTVLTEEPGAFKKIEKLGGIVIRAGGEGPTAEIDIQLDEQEAGDELLAKIAPHLRQIEQITHLRLQNTRVTDAGLEKLKGMSNIVSVNLEGTSISDRGLDSLKTITSLKCVLLAGTRVTDGGILALKRALPDVWVYRVISVSRRKSTE
jgi:thiol-disulfide isomerase/thioredoxin